MREADVPLAQSLSTYLPTGAKNMYRRFTGLWNLFSAAAFSQTRSGGIPLPNLTPSARAGHKKNWTGNSHNTTSFAPHERNGAREVSRRLAFKAKHGHFA